MSGPGRHNGRHGARRAMAEKRAKRPLARRPPWKFARLRGVAGTDQAEGHGRFPRMGRRQGACSGSRTLRAPALGAGVRRARCPTELPHAGGESMFRSLETAENVCPPPFLTEPVFGN
jgi:hypothetical protein